MLCLCIDVSFHELFLHVLSHLIQVVQIVPFAREKLFCLAALFFNLVLFTLNQTTW